MSENEKNSSTSDFSLNNIRRIIVSRLRRVETLGDLIEYCKMMWSKRFNLPIKSKILGTYTPYELIMEVLSWDFLDNPTSVDKFIAEDNGENGDTIDDETWFKTQMGDSYHTIEEKPGGKKVDISPVDLSKIPEGEYSFGDN